jgi:uncharacterized protein (TIGR02466 family)
MQYINLFHTPIGFAPVRRTPTEDEFSFITEQIKYHNNFNSISENNYILNSPELHNLKQFIETNLNEFFQETYAPRNPDLRLKITQSWVTYTKNKEAHHQHYHPNSLVSGVYYPQTYSDDTIEFINSNIPQIYIAADSNKWNPFNSKAWTIPVETGMLIFFPSTTFHRVPVVNHNSERISLAFNTFPNGVIGDNQGLTELSVSC